MKAQRVSTNTKIAEWNSKMAYEYRVLQVEYEKLKGKRILYPALALVAGVWIGRFVL